MEEKSSLGLSTFKKSVYFTLIFSSSSFLCGSKDLTNKHGRCRCYLVAFVAMVSVWEQVQYPDELWDSTKKWERLITSRPRSNVEENEGVRQTFHIESSNWISFCESDEFTKLFHFTIYLKSFYFF